MYLIQVIGYRGFFWWLTSTHFRTWGSLIPTSGHQCCYQHYRSTIESRTSLGGRSSRIISCRYPANDYERKLFFVFLVSSVTRSGGTRRDVALTSQLRACARAVRLPVRSVKHRRPCLHSETKTLRRMSTQRFVILSWSERSKPTPHKEIAIALFDHR